MLNKENAVLQEEVQIYNLSLNTTWRWVAANGIKPPSQACSQDFQKDGYIASFPGLPTIYCKRSKARQWEGLGMRLVLHRVVVKCAHTISMQD